MRVEIITVGTELVSGKALDTHSFYLSQECSLLGFHVAFHTSVGDSMEELEEVIQVASNRSQLVFLCGGLGPTQDDLTKEALARFLGIDLVQDRDIYQHIEGLFAKFGLDTPSNNIKQSYVFPEGQVFFNLKGTAPGLAITHNQVTFILLPGPSRELKQMFQTSVIPFLKGICRDIATIYSTDLSFFGIGESLLEQKAREVVVPDGQVMMATYAKEFGVLLRLSAEATNEKEAKRLVLSAKAKIIERLGDYCFSDRNELLADQVVALLRQRSRSVSTAESCTGGLLANFFSTVPGSSGSLRGGLVCYSNQAKEKLVGVPRDILMKYGTISYQTAKCLADNTLQLFNSDFAISITGVAGPAEVENKPVGRVYIGLAETHAYTRVFQLDLNGSRKRLQSLSAHYALFILWQRLKKGEIVK